MTSLRTLNRPFPARPSTVAIPAAPQSSQPRREYRERDFGVGYGKSSGYASDKRYANAWGQLLFRCS